MMRRCRYAAKRRRPLRCESLEDRRLLVSEGEVFTFNGAYSTAGIVGDVSGEVRWGDGTTSPVDSLSGGNSSSDLRIRFDYSLDTGGFFSGVNQSRRVLLEIAADVLIDRFADDLAAITPEPGFKVWEPSVFHPSQGPANELAGTRTSLGLNPVVAANEIVVFAGARDLPGSARGVGGPASFRFPSVTVTCMVQSECDQKLAEIEAFKDSVRGRGEPGALLAVQTDTAPHFGSVGFDNQTNWYFGIDPDPIQSDQVDFVTVATHEIAHVLGFGITRDSAITSWAGLTGTGLFNGAQATAAYAGNGAPPIEANHWGAAVLDQAGQRTLMAPEIELGKRQLFTDLDFAAMDDLGWDVIPAQATVSAQHRFPDDGIYPVDLVLRGSRANQVVHRIAEVTVTNTAPSLAVTTTQNATVGRPLNLINLGELIDPGFANPLGSPPTAETFTATIDWGDGSQLEQVPVAIDAQGNASGALTIASFDATHTYNSAGTKTVTVQVSDDDGGTDQASLNIVVSPPPTLSLELSTLSIDEDDGNAAATLTVRRSGAAFGSAQTIDLMSSDTSEVVIPSSAVIPPGATSVTVDVSAIDDALLDGDVTVQLTASASDAMPGEIDLIVRDRESLTAGFLVEEILENTTVPTKLVVGRSNTDTQQPLLVNVSGGDASQFSVPATITIPANEQQISVEVTPVNDNASEPSALLTYTLTADGYQVATATIGLLDDEPPLFQNPNSRFDVDNSGEVTAFDALSIIIVLGRRGESSSTLDPQVEQPGGIFVDTNGDYIVSALDALAVINELARQANGSSADPEPASRLVAPSLARQVDASAEDDDAEDDDESDDWILLGVAPTVL